MRILVMSTKAKYLHTQLEKCLGPQTIAQRQPLAQIAFFISTLPKLLCHCFCNGIAYFWVQLLPL